MAYKKLKLWFDTDLANELGAKIHLKASFFDVDKYVSFISSRIDDLELKDRIEVFADAFQAQFSSNYHQACGVIQSILGPENELEEGMFKKYYWIMPFAKYVEKYGLNDFDLSIKTLEEITKRSTSEYAIRPFLEHLPDKTLHQMLNWSKNENFHVRRLSCEGLRPRLPWSSKLNQFIHNPHPILPILHNLKDDPIKYVQKSVANCINDILKDNPTVGKTLITEWSQDCTKARKWIIKHALRNLIKSDEKWAIDLVNSIKY